MLISKPKCPFCKKETIDTFVSEFHNYAEGSWKKNLLVVCTNCKIILRCKMISHKEANTKINERRKQTRLKWE